MDSSSTALFPTRPSFILDPALQRRLLTLSAIVVWACSGPTSPVNGNVAAAPSRASGPSAQLGYCARLQPLLDRAARSAHLGTELECLDLPNVTGLGWFGAPSAGEESKLRDCFAEESEYLALHQDGGPAFTLAIDDVFTEELENRVGASLGSLVPWLPRFSVRAGKSSRISARVAIQDAHFVTLVGVATKLQDQSASDRCLEALCRPDYSYVQKALIGTPSVTVHIEDEAGKALELSAGIAELGFSDRAVSGGGHELTSKQPVTLAIARSAFRTPQTERLCAFCGKRGQACCSTAAAGNGSGAVSSAPPCDGGLGCYGNLCVEVGAPGQPCDAGVCSGGATCVGDVCQRACGDRGQPCCAEGQCAQKLRCTPHPENAIEQRVSIEEVTVSGGFLGTDEDRAFGLSSCGPLKERTRYAVTKLESGRGGCENAWWFEPKNTKDCRVAARFQVSFLGEVRCRVEAFALPPPKPDVCQ